MSSISPLLRMLRVKMDGIWEPMTHYISPYVSPFEWKEPERPLGRWGRDGDVDLKADYANMDSCGDVMCGKPDYFKKNKIIKKGGIYK